MNTGNCRHCGAGRIAKDALECRECGGWRPNPGLLSRTGARLRIILGVCMLLAGVLGIWVAVKGAYGALFYVALFVPGGLASLARPYGTPGTPPGI